MLLKWLLEIINAYVRKYSVSIAPDSPPEPMMISPRLRERIVICCVRKGASTRSIKSSVPVESVRSARIDKPFAVNGNADLIDNN